VNPFDAAKFIWRWLLRPTNIPHRQARVLFPRFRVPTSVGSLNEKAQLKLVLLTRAGKRND